MPNNQIDIHAEAFLVNLHISCWTARKYDRKVSDKLNKDMNASTDASRVNKHLLPGNNETYTYLTSYLGYVRRRHYELTLAWDDDGGARLLPHANHSTYRDFEAESKHEFLTVVYPPFREAYPDMKENAKLLLGDMHVDADYPGLNELDRKFAITFDYGPVPKSDFRCSQLNANAIRELEARHEAKIATAVETAMGDAWQRLFTCVESLQERLDTPNPKFRATLMDNLRECCDVLSRLNVMHDPRLEAMRQAAMQNIARFAPEDLKNDDRLRASVARTAGDLMTQMRGVRRLRTAVEAVAA